MIQFVGFANQLPIQFIEIFAKNNEKFDSILLTNFHSLVLILQKKVFKMSKDIGITKLDKPESFENCMVEEVDISDKQIILESGKNISFCINDVSSHDSIGCNIARLAANPNHPESEHFHLVVLVECQNVGTHWTVGTNLITYLNHVEF